VTTSSNPPGRRNSPHGAGFDFTLHMRQLCQDAATRVPDLRHIDISRVALGFCQTRKPVRHGMYASLTPLRFAGGRMHVVRRGRKWGIQRLHDANGREMLYVLNFYLPRFLDLDFRNKIVTIFHELWHISPKFNGDVRRFGGRCYAHSGSQKHFDAQAAALADHWLSLDPPSLLYDFLRHDFRSLVEYHGQVYGRKIAAPKMIPVD
jgi:hypothetical protein